MSLTCGITITTHNRRADLERTFSVLQKLDPSPDEILVCADGCTDGTVEILRTSFPKTKVLVHEKSLGSIAGRDEMMRRASSDVLLTIDDDSYPLELDAIARIRDLFSSNPRLALASFPQRSDEAPETLEQADFGPAHFVGTYSSAAAAIRRGAFLEVGGYVPMFYHAYEEPDLSLRLVASGWEVKFTPGLVIRHHYTGVQRNEMRTHHFHARSELWSVLMRCPTPQWIAVAVFRLVRQFGYAKKRGINWMLREPVWWLQFCRGLYPILRMRQPIPWRKYKDWMNLVRTPICSESEWRSKFGPS